MLTYSDFYDMSVYANDNWRGKFTPKEIACNAEDLFMEYKESLLLKELTSPIKSLVTKLKDDVVENAIASCEEPDVIYWLSELNGIGNKEKPDRRIYFKNGSVYMKDGLARMFENKNGTPKTIDLL